MAYLLYFQSISKSCAKYQLCVMTLLVLLSVTIINIIRIEIRSQWNEDVNQSQEDSHEEKRGMVLIYRNYADAQQRL